MSFRRAKNFGFALMILILIVVGFIPTFVTNRIDRYNADFLTKIHELGTASGLQKIFWEASLRFSEVLNGSGEDFDGIISHLKRANGIIRHLENELKNENAVVSLESTNTLHKSIRKFTVAVIQFKDEYEEDPSADNTLQMEMLAIEAQREANDSFTQFFDNMIHDVIKNQENISKTIESSQLIALSGLLLGITAGILAAFIVGRAINKPVRRLLEGTQKIASGDLSFRVDDSASDEIGRLACAFNRMSGKLHDYVKEQEDLASLAAEAAESEKRKSDELAGTVRQLNKEIDNRKKIQSELIDAKQYAEQANQAKSDFLANMSHELRTPLNHILGFTQLVVSEKMGQLNADQSEYLYDVLDSGNHLLSLINDILDLSKLEAGKLELLPEPVELRPLLENSLTMVKEKAMKNGITLTHDINGIPDTIIADERKLKQIIYNLLSNAVKFTPPNGEVSILGKKYNTDRDQTPDGDHLDDAVIIISVIDTGIGLKREDIERVFRPFEQAEISKSKKYQGTGLGLSLTKKMVELHGGQIWVESEGENKGCNFSFILPLEPCHSLPN